LNVETIAAVPAADTFADTFADTVTDSDTNAFAVDERLTGRRERALEISWNNINGLEFSYTGRKLLRTLKSQITKGYSYHEVISI